MMRTQACVGGLPVMVMVAMTMPGAAGAEPVGLKPSDAVETTRFMMDPATISSRNPHGAVSIAPDGRRWVARLVRGDTERNGVWMTMVVGETTSLAHAANVRTVARLFSTGLGAGEGRAGANQDTLAQASPLRWLDNRRVAFLWSDASGRRQVMSVDVEAGVLVPLTTHTTPVVSFDAVPDGAMVYSASAPDPRRDLSTLLREGFVIDARTDGTSVFQRRINEGSFTERLWRTEWFVKRAPAQDPLRIALAGRDASPTPAEAVWLSDTQRWALISAVAPTVPGDWDEYREDRMARRVRYARTNPYSMLGRLVHQFWVLDVESGHSRPLWPVPLDPETVRCAWSPEAHSVLIAPTFLPTSDTDARGRVGTAAVIVERRSGRYEILPVDLRDQSVAHVRWLSPDRVLLEAGERGSPQRLEFGRSDDQWRRVEVAQPAATGIRLEIRQDIDTPPTLVAVDPVTGEMRVVVDPNPSLGERRALGRAERIGGEIDAERRWRGLLFRPPAYQSGRRYPLVIQSVYGSAIRDEFTIYGFQNGYGLGPSLIPPYPGRLLAQHDVLVLQLNIEGDDESSTPREAPLRAAAFEHAARYLIEQGLADPQRVGLIGFSRNGFFVEYALTHSDFPYAAAIVVDYFDAGYMAHTLIGYDSSGKDVNDGVPYGDALRRWLEHAPAFNADRVRTPLLQIEQSRGLLGVLIHWEMFSRLRYLKKPVEFWVMPNAEYGVHNTQNPQHLIALQTRVMDWFRFWLNREESADPLKSEQYDRWRALRELQEAQTTGSHRRFTHASNGGPTTRY